jgi:hypothetical protein
MAEFIKRNGHNNETLDGEGFFISYNADPSGGIPMFEADGGGAETAIVVHDDVNEYRILNGDFRKEYTGIVGKGLNACIEFYDSKKDEHGSFWST